MDYCPAHARGLIPAGYDTRHRRPVPARWHPVSRWAITWAQAWVQAFDCRDGITVHEVPCDLCENQHDRDHA
jgi:hypothetical protein